MICRDCAMQATRPRSRRKRTRWTLWVGKWVTNKIRKTKFKNETTRFELKRHVIWLVWLEQATNRWTDERWARSVVAVVPSSQSKLKWRARQTFKALVVMMTMDRGVKQKRANPTSDWIGRNHGDWSLLVMKQWSTKRVQSPNEQEQLKCEKERGGERKRWFISR